MKGAQKQMPSQRNIQVGIDFGTSSTKIAFKPLNSEIVTPIVFSPKSVGDVSNEYPSYCLPSLVAFRDMQLIFGYEAANFLKNRGRHAGFRYTKILVANTQDDVDYQQVLDSFTNYRDKGPVWGKNLSPEFVTSLYIAYVLRLVRRRIEANPDLRGTSLNLAFNICAPIDTFSTVVRDKYEKIIAAAESIERSDKWRQIYSSQNIDAVHDLFESAQYNPSNNGYLRKDPQARVFMVPEAFAQVRAYCSSVEWREGIHAVVDIGAGTTDVSVCYMCKRDGYPTDKWLSACVTPKGTVSIGLSLTNLSEIKTQSHKAWQNAYGMYMRAFEHVAQPAFTGDRVSVFLCGGGANLPGATNLFTQSWMNKWGPYRPVQLYKPRNFACGDSVPFGRLAVAYGLSRPIPQYRIELPNDIPNEGAYRPIELDKSEWIDEY